MKEVKKSKRVSWAAEANLCQWKIFEPEVGLEASSDPPSKASNSNMMVSDGFLALSLGTYKGKSHVNPSPSNEKVVPCIPVIEWRTPPEINVHAKWHIAAGEESEEVKVQTRRLARYIHTLSPHSSAVPPRPSISLDAEDQYFDDRKTPIIPIAAVEAAEQMEFPSDESAPVDIWLNSQPPNLPPSPSTFKVLDIPRCKPLPSPEPSDCQKFDLTTLQDLGDPVVAAAAAATAIMKLKDPGSSIDPELLIKLLRNPKMTEKLIKEWAPSSSTKNEISASKGIELPLPQPSFLMNTSSFDSCASSKSGADAIRTTMMAAATLSKTIANGTTTETGLAPGRKPIERSLHFLNTTPISLVQKFRSENIQRINDEDEVHPRSVSHPLGAAGKIPTCIEPKLVTMSVNFPSLTSGLLSGNSSGEHWQTADAGFLSVATSSVTLSSSTPDLLREKSLNAAEHPSFPLATPLSSMMEPLRQNFQSTELLPTAFQASASSLTRPSVSSPKDINYLRSLIRQHGEAKNTSDAELSQHEKTHYHLQTKKSDIKYQKPCMFHNSSKGCRKGPYCPYLHDMPQRRSDSVLEAPGSKRMKLDGKFT